VTADSGSLVHAVAFSGTLSTVLRDAADRWGPRTVLYCDRRRQQSSFAELDELADHVASALGSRGIGAGSRVAIMFHNDLEFPACWLGIARAGAATVPLNVRLGPADLAHAVAAARPALMIADEEFSDVLASALPLVPEADRPTSLLIRVGAAAGGLREELAAPEPSAAAASGPGSGAADGPWPESTANVQFTSGSTGLSKGCLLSHRYWIAIGEAMRLHGPRLHSDDVLLTAQPFSYMDPQWNLVAALLTGARLVVLERFRSSTFWPAVQEHGATFFYCLGVMPAMLLRTPAREGERDHRVRYIACSAIPAGRHAELEDRFGAPWYELYGSTETGADVLVEADEHDLALRSGTIGRALPHREVRIVDERGAPVPRGTVGRLLVRGTALSDGYLDDGAGSSAGTGWYATGDLAVQTPDGYLHFRGREKDIIRRSGENVSAAQVEEVVQAHPAVRVCACVPVADEIRGEEIKAYVVPVPGTAVELADLIEHTRTQLASFKVPRFWELRTGLPLTPSEKVAKAELRSEPVESLGPCYDAVSDRWQEHVAPLPPASLR
jgi:crotonobetaine/carnitine-CoA ligase